MTSSIQFTILTGSRLISFVSELSFLTRISFHNMDQGNQTGPLKPTFDNFRKVISIPHADNEPSLKERANQIFDHDMAIALKNIGEMKFNMDLIKREMNDMDELLDQSISQVVDFYTGLIAKKAAKKMTDQLKMAYLSDEAPEYSSCWA